MKQIDKSIQELENDYWPDQKEYPSGLVERCHRYRKIKIKELEIHQIITLLVQDIGAIYLMPIVLEKMEKDIEEEDDYDGSSFLESIEIENLMGGKRYERILKKMEEKISPE